MIALDIGKRGKISLLALGLLVIMVAVLLTMHQSDDQEDPQAAGPNMESVVLQTGAVVEYRWVYTLCGEEEMQTHPLPEGWLGLDEEGLMTLDPEAEILHLSPQRVVLEKPIEAWCPVHAVYRYITITDEYVTVYRGTHADPRFIMLQEIPAEQLYDKTYQLLEKGILTQRDSGVERLLEGITD